jgi:hypothetical protein
MAVHAQQLAIAIAAMVALTGCATERAASPAPPPPSTASRAPWPSAPGPGRVDVAWSLVRAGDVVRVEVRATIEPGWHLYGLTSEYGVRPSLELDLEHPAALVGPLVEPPAVAELALDELPITAHRGDVAFVQSVSSPAAAKVPARFRWQVCNDPDTYCAPGVSEVTLLLPGPDGRAPGPWELTPGLTLELVPARGAWSGSRDGPSAYPRLLVASGHEEPKAEVSPPPGVSVREPLIYEFDDDVARAPEGGVATSVGLVGPTGGTLTVRITHLGATRTVVLPFAP